MENSVHIDRRKIHLVAIGDIPLRHSEQDDRVLEERCLSLFRQKEEHQVMILTRHGEIALGFETLEDVIMFYRAQGEIRSVHLIPDGIALDLMRGSSASYH